MSIDYKKLETMEECERDAYLKTLPKENLLKILEHYTEKLLTCTQRMTEVAYERLDQQLPTHLPSKVETNNLLNRLMS